MKYPINLHRKKGEHIFYVINFVIHNHDVGVLFTKCISGRFCGLDGVSKIELISSVPNPDRPNLELPSFCETWPGRTVELGIMMVSLCNGEDMFSSWRTDGRARQRGSEGSPTVTSIFLEPLGVAITWTPWANGFRTGFLDFLELPLEALCSATSAISLAISSRLGFRRALIAASSSLFCFIRVFIFFSLASCCFATASRSTSRFSTRLGFRIPPRTLEIEDGNNGSTDSRLTSVHEGAVLDRRSDGGRTFLKAASLSSVKTRCSVGRVFWCCGCLVAATGWVFFELGALRGGETRLEPPSLRLMDLH